jgi:hypothetical protein
METTEISRPRAEPGYALGFGLIALLVVPQLVVLLSNAPFSTPLNQLLVGFYLVSFGCMFVASYYFSHKSFFLRWLAWLCERGSIPAHRKMAFFYFALGLILGGMSVLGGLGLFGDCGRWHRADEAGVCAATSDSTHGR